MKLEDLLIKSDSPARRLTMVSLILLCMGVTAYCHFVLRTPVVYSHVFYVPIVLAGIWWGMLSLAVSLFLGGWLILSHWVSGIEASYPQDLLRILMFLVIGGLVGVLWREFHRTEKQLRETRDFLRSLVSSSRIPTVVWNEFGIVTMFNQALGELTGYEPAQILGQPVRALFSSRVYEELQSALEEAFRIPQELPIRCSDGKEALCLWSAAAIPGPDGKTPAAWMVQGLDITKRKWAEGILTRHVEQMRQLNERLTSSESRLVELNATKDKFFSIISHDLRTPFVPLLLYSELLLKEQDQQLSPRQREIAAAIQANARRLSGLVDNLLDWSRIQTGLMGQNPEEMDAEDLIGHNLALLKDTAAAKGISLAQEVGPGLRVWCDRYHVNCVLQNLISNAIKFTPGGGAVKVVAEPEEGKVRVSVIDDGVGMDEEAQSAVFRLDVRHTTPGTAKERGSGLGLVLCRELLEKNGSLLQLTSRPGEGSAFFFTLPAGKPAA